MSNSEEKNNPINNVFCIDCGSYLRKINEKEKKLYLECSECGLETEVDHFTIPHILKKMSSVPLIHENRKQNDYVYENRFKRTKQLECKSKKCKVKNPEIILITSSNKTAIEYLCSNCKTIW
jgi:hypothetical protein